MDEFQVPEDDISFIRSSQFKNLLASSIPSFVMRPILHPLDVLKIRFQVNRNQLSIKEAIKYVHGEEGWQVLFRGLYFSQFVSVISSILQFSMYRSFRNSLHNSSFCTSNEGCDFIAGFLMGATSSILINPLDVVRTLLLARSTSNKNGVIKITQGIYNNGKILGFYTGAYAGIWHVGALNGMRFMFYNGCCRLAMNYENVHSHKELRPIQLIASGVVGGCLANFVSYPLDFIRRRIQSDTNLHLSQPRTTIYDYERCFAIIQCALNVAKNEGVIAFYNGFLPNATKSIISTAVQFSCYDLIYKWIGKIVD